MSKMIRLTVLLIVLSGTTALPAEIYVSPEGNDANPGTKERPLSTLAAARDMVRRVKATKREPIRVLLRGGTYRLEKPVVFKPADSGSAECPIIYMACPGEKPVISGGRRLIGWQKRDNHLWTMTLPQVKQGQWYFRQLFVDGQRRPRARLPREGLYQVAGPGDPPKRSFQYKPGEIDPKWRNLDNVEVVLLQFWTEGRLRIESIDESAHMVRFTGNVFRPTAWSCGWFVENVYEGLTAPGQWYLDRQTGVLYYWPLPGENMEQLEVVAPRTRHWVRLEGNYQNGQLVEYVTFRGLIFHHTSWSLDEKLGYSYPQAAIEQTPGEQLWAGHHAYVGEGQSIPQSQIEVPAGIYAEGSHHVRFEDNEILQTGGWAIDLALGCHDNTIAGNYIHDVGAGGIRVGSPNATFNQTEESCRTTITDNTLRDGCSVYLGSPAIWTGMSSGNRIAHNEISGRWQWAISVGFQWGYMPPQNARDNIIEYNHCHHVDNDPLNTHAVIYLLGVQPGTAVRHNHIHHCPGAHGICLDNSSVGIVVEYNVVHHQQRGSLVFNYNDLGNIIQNNVFAFAQNGQMFRAGDTGKLDQTGVFYRNIFYWKNDRLFNRSQWPNHDIVMDYNLYYDAGGGPVTFTNLSFDEWKKKGVDRHSIIADPLFVDPDHGDFTLKPDSPAFRLGFRPIDLNGVGPRPRPAGK